MKVLENQLLMVNDVLRANRKKLAEKRQEVEGNTNFNLNSTNCSSYVIAL